MHIGKEYQIVHPKVEKDIVVGSKVLVNPYQGCSHNCLFCPANDGYLKRKSFEEYRERRVIHVVENVVDHLNQAVKNKTDKFHVHLSPVADPFQPIEARYRLSESILMYCYSYAIPVAICTKGIIPDRVIPLLRGNSRSFVQISIPSIDQKKNSFIVRGDGARINELLQMTKKLVNQGIAVILRVDPIFPYITDDEKDFEQLVSIAKQIGIRFILSSVVDIVDNALDREKEYLESYERGLYEKYKKLFSESIHNRYHAKKEYRYRIFETQRAICERYGLSYGITWEPDDNGASINEKYNLIQTCDQELYLKLRG